MTIIEREIERREALIVEKAAKEAKVVELKAELEKTQSEIAGIDDAALRAEIDELRTYLPKPESDEPEPNCETFDPFSL